MGGLTLPTPVNPEPEPSKNTGLRTVGGLKMPSLPEPPVASRAPSSSQAPTSSRAPTSIQVPIPNPVPNAENLKWGERNFTIPNLPAPFQAPSQAASQPSSQPANTKVRSGQGPTTYKVPSLPTSQVPSHSSNNGLPTGGRLTVPSLPQVPGQPSTNRPLRSENGLTTLSTPSVQPPKRPESTYHAPNNGQLPRNNNAATSNIQAASFTDEGRRAAVDGKLSHFLTSLTQTENYSSFEMLCRGCATPKEDCDPFWLCGNCKPNPVAQKSRELEYEALKEQFRVYNFQSQGLNNKLTQENAKHLEQNKLLTERNHKLEEESVKYQQQNKALTKRNQELEGEAAKNMSIISQAQATEKANKELQQKNQQQVKDLDKLARAGKYFSEKLKALAGGSDVLMENMQLRERVHDQAKLIDALKQKTGDNYFTTTGGAPASSQIAPVGLPGQVSARSRSPANQGVRQPNQNSLAVNQTQSPGQNPNAAKMGQAVSSRTSQVGAAVGHGRVPSQGTIHYPSNQGAPPQPNVNVPRMNIGNQSSNGVPIQGMSPGQNSNAVAMGQTASPRPSQAGTAMVHSRTPSQGTVHFPSTQATSQYQTPNTVGMGNGRSPGQPSNGTSTQGMSAGRSPNGFAVNHTQNYGNGVNAAATVGQGNGPNGFAMNQNAGVNQGGNGVSMNNGGQGQGSHLQVGNGGAHHYPSPTSPGQ